MKSQAKLSVFTMDDTLRAKGAAILVMLVHHLFAFPYRLIDPRYVSVLPWEIHGLSLENYIARFGKICVAVFLLLSGYVMQKSRHLAPPKDRAAYSVEKILKFYFAFWICFVVFVPIGLVFFNNQERYFFNLPNFFMNLFGFAQNYNEEWWFIKTYLALMLLYPLYAFLNRKNKWLNLAISAIAFLLSDRVLLPGNFLRWQLPFVLGIFLADTDFFDRNSQDFFKQPLAVLFGLLAVFFLFFRIDGASGAYIFFTPFFIHISSRLTRCARVGSFFSLCGKYSLYMWLTHTFFCFYYFQKLVFYPRYSPLIFLWLTALSLISAFALTRLQEVIRSAFPLTGRR